MHSHPGRIIVPGGPDGWRRKEGTSKIQVGHIRSIYAIHTNKLLASRTSRCVVERERVRYSDHAPSCDPSTVPPCSRGYRGLKNQQGAQNCGSKGLDGGRLVGSGGSRSASHSSGCGLSHQMSGWGWSGEYLIWDYRRAVDHVRQCDDIIFTMEVTLNNRVPARATDQCDNYSSTQIAIKYICAY